MAARSAFGRRVRRHVTAVVIPGAIFSYIGGGGAVSGGAASTEAQVSGLSIFAYTGQGGATAGGTAPKARARAVVGQGGAASGGSAVTSYSPAGAAVYAYAGSGGASSGGSAQTDNTYVKVFYVALEVPAS
jgi:hypothetical protein